eukprot:CAMPEP_0181485814 /NCGR_PEP_ID=MMETSP1110-20121109/46779_2 /TAXON_ID=174948 /ORGANISM="Symbiodinium sp., Strain CCMP421" /LENGTH=279 /DNA_ID=CAMNT_0023611865 /DNA_START=55 /DNA_END=894 /DNA_ORIENTATION=-
MLLAQLTQPLPHVCEVRPLPLLMLRAHQGQLRHIPRHRKRPLGFGVRRGGGALQRALRLRHHDLEDRVHDGPILAHACRHRVQQHLHDHHAIRVDLRLLRDLARLDVMRAGIARGPADLVAGHVELVLVLGDAGQPKVRHLCCPTPVKQDVRRLDVAMKGLWGAVVHVRQSTSGIQRHPKPLHPAEGRHRAVLAPCFGQAPSHVPTLEELVNQVPPAAAVLIKAAAPAHERHQVGVPELAQHQDLICEAGGVLLVHFDHFDGDLMAVLQGGSVHATVVA